ncbi:hypothetical protein EC991_001302 [Linnemannia zychae]|nr:hypothetical protein EC991_001302 [Linnemannia zychae]
MSNPVQVSVPFLDRLICLGPSASQDIRVYGDNQLAEPDKAHGAPTGLTTATTDNSNQNEGDVKKGFEPQRKYYLEGRIIHKRKLSRRLFFLDVSLVRRKSGLCNDIAILGDPDVGGVVGGSGSTLEVDLTESEWEDIEAEAFTTMDSKNEDSKQHATKSSRRMEVIARFPTHTLKELDDLWRRVQLGAVIRVFGDIEISEKKRPVSEQQQEDQQQQTRWSALLHCLDFEVLESWRGKDAFEPNPGSAEISNGTGQDGGGGIKVSERKRKSGEISGDPLVSPRPEKQQQRGDESQPHCKFWLNSGKCSKEVCVFWHETDPMKLKAERRQWVDERIQAKRQISHHASDPHQKTTKNQHRERALYFAKWLIDTFSREFLNSGSGVLDIAGGRGDLSWELQTRQGIRSTVVEPRPGKGMRKWQHKWLEKFKANSNTNGGDGGLESSTAQDKGEFAATSSNTDVTEDQEPDADKTLDGLTHFIPTVKTQPLQATEPSRIQAMLDDEFLTKREDLVNSASIMIGLHPDQATEPIVRAALKAQKPFAIIPCCVFGRDNPHRRLPKDIGHSNSSVVLVAGEEEDEDPSTRPVTSYDDFVTWLATLHPDIKTTWLNFEGMNRVLYWEGPGSS